MSVRAEQSPESSWDPNPMILTYTADWGFYTSTDMILSNSNHLLFLLPFLLSTFPAHTSRSLPSPHLPHGGHPTGGCRGPSSRNDTAVHLCISPLPLIWGQSWGYLLGLRSYYNELALETSSRQKPNILTLYLSNL